MISLICQAIRDFDKSDVTSASPNVNCFEPLFMEHIAHFHKLMEQYYALITKPCE